MLWAQTTLPLRNHHQAHHFPSCPSFSWSTSTSYCTRKGQWQSTAALSSLAMLFVLANLLHQLSSSSSVCWRGCQSTGPATATSSSSSSSTKYHPWNFLFQSTKQVSGIPQIDNSSAFISNCQGQATSNCTSGEQDNLHRQPGILTFEILTFGFFLL